MFTTSNKRRILEVIAVVLTGASKFIFVDVLPYKFWFITIAIIFWVAYILFRSVKNPEVLGYWGFQQQNFKKLFLQLLPIALLIITGFLMYGFTTRH